MYYVPFSSFLLHTLDTGDEIPFTPYAPVFTGMVWNAWMRSDMEFMDGYVGYEVLKDGRWIMEDATRTHIHSFSFQRFKFIPSSWLGLAMTALSLSPFFSEWLFLTYLSTMENRNLSIKFFPTYILSNIDQIE